MSARGLNLLVFREGRRRLPGEDLKRALLSELAALRPSSPVDQTLTALLRAGELECGVADGDIGRVQPLADLTEGLARALLAGDIPHHFQATIGALSQAPVPEWLDLSTPEGFAYYALHPLAYAKVLDQLPAMPGRLVVVGVRSIGATLSAVTSAAARLRGIRVERITVRPTGHPYDRQTEFSQSELHVIQEGNSGHARFLIVDEGPGLSGSSFLSVAEALEGAGVAPGQIVLLCAHQPNPETLCATNAAQRWRRFSCVSVAGEIGRPAEAVAFAGGGEWRSRIFVHESAWPACWTTMERLKYLSFPEAGERRLFKFGGLGHYGDAVFERETRLAEAGFAPAPRRESDGFVSYRWVDGNAMTARDPSSGVLARLAEYCAFRARAFVSAGVDLHSLQQMADHNLLELGFHVPVTLKLERPVFADGRMQPHEWILTREGRLLKTDCGSHGDDHFYPGPTDIAWDLAGAIVEWQISEAQAAEFLALYQRFSGDDPRSRISDFVVAYTVFRCAYCHMAASAMPGTPESVRLDQAAAGYAGLLRARTKIAAIAPSAIHPGLALAAEIES